MKSEVVLMPVLSGFGLILDKKSVILKDIYEIAVICMTSIILRRAGGKPDMATA